METMQPKNKPWALLYILLGIVALIMAWTSYGVILRILVTMGGLFLVDYGMGLLGLPQVSQMISSAMERISGKR